MKDLGRSAVAVLALLFWLTAAAGLFGCAAGKGKTAAPQAAGKGDVPALAAGDAALARGDRAEAGRQYLAALKAGADAATVHTRLGDLLLPGAADKARSEYEKALKANGKYAPAWQGLGFALYRAGSETEAAEALKKALDRDPGLSRAAALLGVIENRQGHPEAALAVLDAALAVRFDPDLENNRGLSLLLLNRPGEAEAAFRKALDAKKSPKIVNNLGLALCRQRRYDDAYAAFTAAGPEAAALNNLGVCFMEAGDKARAQQYFERAIAANPAYYPKAQTNLRRLSTMEEVSLPAPAAPPQIAPAPVDPPVSAAPAKIVRPPVPVSHPLPDAVAPTRNSSETEKADRSERP